MTLYPVSLLNLPHSFNHFFCRFLVYFVYMICQWQFYFFLSNLYVFYLFFLPNNIGYNCYQCW